MRLLFQFLIGFTILVSAVFSSYWYYHFLESFAPNGIHIDSVIGEVIVGGILLGLSIFFILVIIVFSIFIGSSILPFEKEENKQANNV